MQEKLRAKLAPLFLILLLPVFLSSCLSRQEVLADVWLESGMSHGECVTLCANYCNSHAGKCRASCEAHPEQYPNGLYRVLNTKPVTYEIISYCAIGSDKKPIVRHYLSIEDAQFNALLDAYLPKPSGN